MKKIILLNGPSSSGKSTLADTLKRQIKENSSEEYGVVSIDDFLDIPPENTIYEDDVFEISEVLCSKIIELLGTKQGVIIDHVITSERIFEQVNATMKAYDSYLIQVTCPLLELQRRERERKNRCIGSAEASYQYLFPKEGYDCTVDTYQFSAKDCAQQIIDIMK